MTLLQAWIISVGVSCGLWSAITLLPVAFQIYRGRATGFAFVVPTYLRFLPRPLQIPAAFLGLPILVGTAFASFWYIWFSAESTPPANGVSPLAIIALTSAICFPLYVLAIFMGFFTSVPFWWRMCWGVACFQLVLTAGIILLDVFLQ
jgi:hypothetical protein